MFDFDGMTRDIVVAAAIIVVVSFLLGVGIGILL
ncbi:hypothetical protein CPL00146S_CDS0147 [Escherichia phage SmurfNell]|uniref:Uncharacterized protein n=4 Tax=Caudoviricetes TaxID=2731619 RepID=A0A9E7MVR7_9CAUD|nr:hypothetical protein [Salmonella phage SP76]UQT65310.1 hypothetical protein BD13_170 [Salmonella phage BD13]USS19008.1 hypothetical protein [Salmonella phage JN-S202001]